MTPKPEEIKQLRKIAKKRFYSNQRRAKKLGKTGFDFETGWNILLECYNDGFKCAYCGTQLKLKDQSPYWFLPSIDHKIPLSLGGKQEKNNLAVCCVRCNIIKGTLKADTFERLLKAISYDVGLLEKIQFEAWKGKLAYKLERNQIEEEQIKTEEEICGNCFFEDQCPICCPAMAELIDKNLMRENKCQK